jgi:dihydrofolate synthase / folylpolyglutamate synthase
VDFSSALADLEARQPESMPGPSLDRIRAVAELLDHPQGTYPSIQVTGTNGKTTTARLITALACAHGLSTGTFISPHIDSVTERLSICGRPITEDEFGEEYGHVLPFLEQVDRSGDPVTYFEALTALSFVWFSDKPVALGVFEVGMGGTWDATNLVRGDVAVICPIGLDHPQLGSTVREVATEKAGIIKEGRVAVVREQRGEAMDVIERRAADVAAKLMVEGQHFRLESRSVGVGGQALSIQGLHGMYDELFLPLLGEQAARNAAAALAAAEALLGRALDDAGVRKALEAATSPGRLEVVRRRPLVVLDGAHNPDAMTALAQALPETFRWNRLHAVVGMFGDKDVESVVGILAPLVDAGYACASSSPRAAPADRVTVAMHGAGLADAESFDTVPQAVAVALARAGEDDLVLVTGSFYTVADARPLFLAG